MHTALGQQLRIWLYINGQSLAQLIEMFFGLVDAG
jgi:hypothetical protein